MDNVTAAMVGNGTEGVGLSTDQGLTDLEMYMRWRAWFISAIAKMHTPPLATTTISVAFMFLIIAGNVWVIAAVVRQPKLRNSATNVFIVSMSISDLIIGVAFIPIHVADFAYGRKMSDPALCFVTSFLHSCAMCGTTASLICIGVDRYRAIVHPLTPKWTAGQAVRRSAAAWFACAVYSVQVYANSGIKTTKAIFGNETVIISEECSVIRKDIDKWMRVEYFCMLYAIPLIILFVLYGIMIKTLWFGRFPSNNHNRNKKKSVKMLSFVVLQFALTWGPLYSLQLYYTHETNPPYDALLFSNTPANITIMISFCNSCINPVLYAYYNKNFRKEFTRMFPCLYKQSLAVTGSTRTSSMGIQGTHVSTVSTSTLLDVGRV